MTSKLFNNNHPLRDAMANQIRDQLGPDTELTAYCEVYDVLYTECLPIASFSSGEMREDS